MEHIHEAETETEAEAAAAAVVERTWEEWAVAEAESSKDSSFCAKRKLV